MRENRTQIGAVIAAFALATTSAFAADGTWLTSSLSGNWNDSAKWQNGTIGDGVGSVVRLNNPNANGSYTITLQSAETRTVGVLESAAWPTRRYEIGGAGTLDFDNGAGTPEYRILTGLTGVVGIVSANVSGADGLLINGNNSDQIVTWTPASMGITGGLTFEDIRIRITDTASLGNNAISLGGGSATGGFIESNSTALTETLGNNIQLLDGNSGLRNVYGGSTAVRTTDVTGQITESGGPRDMNYTASTGTGRMRYVVSNSNAYTGGTNIGGPSAGAVLVRATHNNALGTGTGIDVTFSTAGTALELSGGVTISGKNITLNGLGYNSEGSLNNVDGNNVWAGGVITGTAETGRIRVSSGQLTVTGVVSGDQALDVTGSLSSILELTNENTYEGGTTLQVGTLLVSNDSALGTGTVQVRPNGTLSINTGIQAAITNLDLSELSFSTLAFTLNGLVSDTGIVVSGNLMSGGSQYNVDIFDAGIVLGQTYTLMTVGGSFDSGLAFNLNIDPAYAGSTLDWSGGALTLTVVPEPAAGMLLAAAMAVMAGLRFRRFRNGIVEGEGSRN